MATTSGLNGEYYCIVERANNREEMTLQAEYSPGITDLDAIQRELGETLRAKLGVRILVELVPPDSLATLTGPRPPLSEFGNAYLASKLSRYARGIGLECCILKNTIGLSGLATYC